MARRLDDFRVMAHHIKLNETIYQLSIAEISPDRKKVEIMPFQAEIHSTPFYNGIITIAVDDNGHYYFEKS